MPGATAATVTPFGNQRTFMCAESRLVCLPPNNCPLPICKPAANSPAILAPYDVGLRVPTIANEGWCSALIFPLGLNQWEELQIVELFCQSSSSGVISAGHSVYLFQSGFCHHWFRAD
jgi:hypothetical protein